MPDQPIPNPADKWKNMSFNEALQHLMENAPAEAWVNTVFEDDMDWV